MYYSFGSKDNKKLWKLCNFARKNLHVFVEQNFRGFYVAE